ncbi:uncharacterized protein LTR77_007636 [Saxophila tyrrhenica]|uniref:MYND-type zinc finger protein samB n=1 Tax=Saxophila tyrrhenica TaxID=1690608 RepID=A0AAV9P2K5_9PEZI|nr:hypothetical protein LTR77_007636 [Saxophila tyrrhenica]
MPPHLHNARRELRFLQEALGLQTHAAPSRGATYPVFVCIDCEAYERDQSAITEIGVAVLDTKDVQDYNPSEGLPMWLTKIKAAHYRPIEHANLLNRQFVAGREESFDFGSTTWISTLDITAVLRRIFSAPADILHAANLDKKLPTDCQDVVFVAHGLRNETKYLRGLGFPLNGQGGRHRVVRCVDTQIVAGGTKKAHPSLQRLLRALKIEPVNLHNAGNDAVYTLHALISMAVMDYNKPGSVFAALQEANALKLPALKYNTNHAEHVYAGTATASSEGERSEFHSTSHQPTRLPVVQQPEKVSLSPISNLKRRPEDDPESSATGTEVKTSPLGGRGLFATKKLAQGDVVIAMDRPLVAVLDEHRIEDTCSWCFSWTELPVLSGAGVNQALKDNWCTGCKKVKYCSKACQSKAWKAIHKQECKKLSAQSEEIPNLVVAAMQILAGLNLGNSLYGDVQNMETHRDEFEKLGAKKWDVMQLMSHTAVKFSGQEDNKSNLERAKMVVCAMMCNSSRLVTPTFDPLGLVLDPSTAVMNHSCSPNAVVVFDGPKLSVRVLERVQQGDEITISYIDSSAPYGVRQAELRDQYFFTCNCSKCKLGSAAPQDAFLETNQDFAERIKVIDGMIDQITQDPAWPRHILGQSTDMKRMSALQFYGYSYLESPDSTTAAQDPSNLRKAITILRNTGVWPISRAPMPALYQQYAVACLGAKRYNEALVALIRLHALIDPTIYPQAHHPVRIVHAWTLATIAKAVSNEPDTPFCKALQSCGVDLPVLFLALLAEIHEQVPRSHGKSSSFGQMVDGAWRTIMGPGGELDEQYSQQGVERPRQQEMLQQQIKELWPKVKAFAADDALAAQIDEALAG